MLYFEPWKKYATFSGRSRRSEFWIFWLGTFVISIVLQALTRLAAPLMIVYIIFGLAVIIPYISVTVRRLHDIGRSGWWYFIGLIPLAGAIILLVFMCTDSQPGDNQFGANPKAVPPPAV